MDTPSPPFSRAAVTLGGVIAAAAELRGIKGRGVAEAGMAM